MIDWILTLIFFFAYEIVQQPPCRENAEGRSGSVSPYTAEKKSYANMELSKSEVVYPLDEEVRKLLAFARIRIIYL